MQSNGSNETPKIPLHVSLLAYEVEKSNRDKEKEKLKNEINSLKLILEASKIEQSIRRKSRSPRRQSPYTQKIDAKNKTAESVMHQKTQNSSITPAKKKSFS